MTIKEKILKVKKIFNKLWILIQFKIESHILVNFIRNENILFSIIIDEYSNKIENYTNTNKYSLWFYWKNIKIWKIELFSINILKKLLNSIEEYTYIEFKKNIYIIENNNINKTSYKEYINKGHYRENNISKKLEKIKLNTINKYSKISIIIPTYNATNKIKKILENFKNIEYKKNDFEIIIVNDWWINKTELLKLIYKYDELNIRFLEQKDLWFRAWQARNMWAKHAKYDILLFIDQDSIPHSKILLIHEKEHKKNNIILWSINWLQIIWNSKFYKKRKSTLQNKILSDFRRNCSNIDMWKLFISWHFSIKKNIFIKNKFDENFIWRWEEDIELWYRLNKNWYKISFSEEAIIFPQIESDKDRKQTVEFKKFKKWLQNTLYFCKKYKNDKTLKKYLIIKFEISYYKNKKNYNIELEKFKKNISNIK